MILLSHPTGNQNSRAVLHAFAKEELLSEFHTSMAVFSESVFQKKLFPALSRRQFDTALKDRIITYPHLELIQRLANRMKLSRLLLSEADQLSMYDTAQRIDRRIAKRITTRNTENIRAVYAYEDMAVRTFESAGKKQLQCIYDLPIGYWRAYRQLLVSEQKQRPEWASTLTGFKSSARKLRQKDRELELADHIFVASRFTAQTLQDYPGSLKAQIHIIPYGFPGVEKAAEERNYDFQRTRRPLKILFVGGLSQRKGLSYLFDAVSVFKDHVELTVVGRRGPEDCRPLDNGLRNCHKWIPTLPHQEVLALMRSSDVLVFPSLFEGFGLVITEAMSQGTPVITTERTAGPDIMTDGEQGHLVQAGCTEALVEKIETFLNQPASVVSMGRAALEAARKRPWKVYGRELTQTILQILNNQLASC